VVLLLCLALHARGDDDWKYDVVHLKNGHTLQGLLVEQNESEVRFRCVTRKPGSHTVVIPTTLDRAEIDSIDPLDPRDRDVLAGRLKALDPTGKGEAERMAALELKPITWGKDNKVKALRFESTHFALESNAPEEIVRRAAVQLEGVYGAYARFLPPRVESAEPTLILLLQSQADYQALLKDQGRNLLNPAFYDPAKNQIVCGTDLQKLGTDLEATRQNNQKTLADLKEKEAKLVELFKPKPVPANLLKPIQDARADVEKSTKQCEEQFQAATRQLFRTLYHEAFHAYLANFVYPPADYEVPRWLNEGLAQIFESAFVEGGELRVGHAEKGRLTAAQAALGKSDLVPIADLLKAGPKQFVVLHASDQQNSDRYYLTSWSAAFYLTFDRRLLGTKKMDEYVKSLKRGTDPTQAFADLVGQTPPQFEKEFHAYLQKLKPDGTVKGQPK
jgi:hypothetical protein